MPLRESDTAALQHAEQTPPRRDAAAQPTEAHGASACRKLKEERKGIRGARKTQGSGGEDHRDCAPQQNALFAAYLRAERSGTAVDRTVGRVLQDAHERAGEETAREVFLSLDHTLAGHDSLRLAHSRGNFNENAERAIEEKAQEKVQVARTETDFDLCV